MPCPPSTEKRALNRSFWTPCTPARALGPAGSYRCTSLVCSIHLPGPVRAVTLPGKVTWSLAFLGPQPLHL